jgi:hypothetical protein
MSLGFAFAALIAYIGIAYGASYAFEQPLLPLLLGGAIVAQELVNNCLRSISSAHSPQYIGYANLLLRGSQAVLGVLLVAEWRWGLVGAVIAASLARTAVLAVLLYLNREVISRSALNLDIIKNWLGRAWLPLYAWLPMALLSLDVLLVRTIYGNEVPIAYYGVAYTFFGIAAMSGQALPALYSRLLAKRDVSEVAEVFWVAFAISVPISILLLIYTAPVLSIYRVEYAVAAEAAKLFVIAGGLRIFSSLMITIVRGLETGDIEGKSLIKTALFLEPTLNTLVTFSYLIGVAAVSYITKDPAMLTYIWGVLFALRFGFLATSNFIIARTYFKVKLPLYDMSKSLIKFIIASVPIILIGYLWQVSIERSIYVLIINLAPPVAICLALYAILLLVLDKKAREIFMKIIAITSDTLRNIRQHFSV